MAAVCATNALARSYDNRFDNVAFLNDAADRCTLYGGYDNVTDIATSSETAAQNSDAHDFFCAGVVCDF